MQSRRLARRFWTRSGYSATALIAFALLVGACVGSGASEPPAGAEAESPAEAVVEQAATDSRSDGSDGTG